MPLQRLVRPFRSFAGDHEGIGGVLSEFLSPRDSKNVYFKKGGAVARVPGFSARNSAYTTDTGGSATIGVGLFPYFTSADALEVVGVFDDETDEYEVAVSADDAATFTFKFDLGTTLNGFLPDAAQLGTKMIMTFGQGSAHVYNGSAVTSVSNTQSPTPTSAAGNAGPLLGQYQFKLVSVESDGSRHPASDASTMLELSNEEADLSWIADPDTNVVGYEIYRKKTTEGLYRRVAYSKGRTSPVAFTDDLADTTIRGSRPMQEHGENPPTGAYFCEVFQKSMWYARTTAKPRSLFYSDPNLPEQVWSESELLLQDADNLADHITGLYGSFDGALIAFQQQTVWTVSGTGQITADAVDWRVRKTNAETGAASHRAIAKVPAGAKFLDSEGNLQQVSRSTLLYLTTELDLRLFDGENATIISHSKRDFVNGINYANRAKAHIQHEPDDGLFIIYVPHGSSQTTVNKALVWNYRLGTMTEIDNRTFASSLTTLTSTGAQLFAGEALVATGGLVYNPWTGNDYGGSGTIDAQFWTERIFAIADDGAGPRVSTERSQRARWIKPIFEALSSSRNVSISLFAGFAIDGATAFSTNTMDITGTNVSHVQQRIRMLSAGGAYSVDRVHRIKVHTNDANAAWVLVGFDLETATLLGVRD